MKQRVLGVFIVLLALISVACPTPVSPDKTISMLAIPGVVGPLMGAIPVTTGIDTEQYTGSIAWSPSSISFAANTVYTAAIILTAKPGWTLSGVVENSFRVAGATASNPANSGAVTAVFPATGAEPDQTISLLAIPGVTPPARAETPVMNDIDTAQYSGTLSWSPSVSESFAANTVYTANIVLTAKTGWTLNGVAENSFSLEGATVSHAINSGTLTAVFPATGAEPDQTITLLAIPGVNPPAQGETPVTTDIDTAQYTGTISWSPSVSGSFAANTVYTANIVLTPKAGWTLTGLVANSFTVASATVSHAAGSGNIAAVFPTTGAATITDMAIPGVIAPVRGETPVTTSINAAQYTGTISWSPVVYGNFAANTVYTANIVLTPKAGWTLTGFAENSFTVAGATASHSANSGAVAAVFPATSSAPITLLAIPGIIAPVRGETAVTTAIDTVQYTGTISWSPVVYGNFAANTVYTANIVLTPKAGWTLTGLAENSFTVAGATASHAANSGAVAAVFPATSPALINLLAIPGIVAPVRGETAVTTAIDTAQYTGTISWSPVIYGNFAANTVYTANIVLTPKAGWTLTGLAANSFTVAGATASHAANSGAIAAAFPATAGAPITLLAIPGIVAPVRGASPVITAIDTAQYTGTMSWSPSVSGSFAASTAYTANIVLTAKVGWTLSGLAANSFTVAGATVSHAASSGTVAAVFPATSPAPITPPCHSWRSSAHPRCQPGNHAY